MFFFRHHLFLLIFVPNGCCGEDTLESLDILSALQHSGDGLGSRTAGPGAGTALQGSLFVLEIVLIELIHINLAEGVGSSVLGHGGKLAEDFSKADVKIEKYRKLKQRKIILSVGLLFFFQLTTVGGAIVGFDTFFK